MTIEFIFNTVTVQPGDQIQEEQFHGLVSMMNSYLAKKRKYKKRKTRKKILAGDLITDIIDSIE